MQRIQHFLKQIRKNLHITRLKDRITRIPKTKRYKKTVVFMERKPFAAFLVGLALLFGVIAVGSVLTNLQKKTEEKKEVVKDVTVFSVHGKPSVTVQAVTKKAGVIKILAQTAGIVRNVSVKDGDEVQKGVALVNLASNYQGANAPAIQAQIAQTQYKNTADTYATQKDLIAKQRDVADKTDANAEELRKIASDSANDTQSLLDLNNTILNTINENLRNLQNTNVNGSNDQLIFQTEQQKSQVQAGVVQLQAQLRNLNYQKAGDKPPAELSTLQKDITKKQLDVQEKALALSLEVSRLQKDLAWVQASVMSPSSPCAGTVERVYVKPGDSVNPGQMIATIKTDNNTATLEALVPSDIAIAVSPTASSSALIDGQQVSLSPYYVSQEATSGQLYSVLYNVPESFTSRLTDSSYLSVTIPLDNQGATQSPYVPLDAVYQTQNEAYIFVVSGDTAKSKRVSLGEVYGKFVAVDSGLSPNDQIIINRNVVSGEKVRVIH